MVRLLAVLVLAGVSVNGQTITETFGTGANQFSIDFVTIGNPRNSADTTGSPNPAGRVDYIYNIGKYEISRAQVLAAIANGASGITLFDSLDAAKPATGINWKEAAFFVNWLNTSKGYNPAYKFSGGTFSPWSGADSGYNPDNTFRNSSAVYFLPSVDEWYKAAYYDPNKNGGLGGYWDYPTGSDSSPGSVAQGNSPGTAVFGYAGSGPANVDFAGGASPFGTIGQGGNVFEWNEAGSNLVDNRVLRGGMWGSHDGFLKGSFYYVGWIEDGGAENGFRIAMIPEPSSLSLLLAGGAAFAAARRRRLV